MPTIRIRTTPDAKYIGEVIVKMLKDGHHHVTKDQLLGLVNAELASRDQSAVSNSASTQRLLNSLCREGLIERTFDTVPCRYKSPAPPRYSFVFSQHLQWCVRRGTDSDDDYTLIGQFMDEAEARVTAAALNAHDVRVRKLINR